MSLKSGNKYCAAKIESSLHKSKVCEQHFEVDDIVKHYRHVINGNEVLIPRGKWALAPGALPRLFPCLPESISKLKVTTQTRRSPRNKQG